MHEALCQALGGDGVEESNNMVSTRFDIAQSELTVHRRSLQLALRNMKTFS